MYTSIDQSIEILDRSRHSDYKAELAKDVCRGLERFPKELFPKYFYDERGSKLFEQITELPEYYQTRTERALLESIAPELAGEYSFTEMIEFGSGSSAKTRLLLDNMTSVGLLERYVPIDVSRDFLVATAEQLDVHYPIHVTPVVGDFLDGLEHIERSGPALVIFLGGTIGNLYRNDAASFLSKIAEGMGEEDALLMGVDLVKDPYLLHLAYNDSQGITAKFNKNVLHVLNRELGGCFDPDSFCHYAFYNPDDTRIEMRLVSGINQSIPINHLDIEVIFEEGESILTEISRKFTKASAERLLKDAGLRMTEWWSDSEKLFGLLLARKR